MAISTNQKPTIYRNLYENTGPDMDNIVCGRCSASQIVQIRICIFSKNINIFRHLKLEIALAIPASNDEK